MSHELNYNELTKEEKAYIHTELGKRVRDCIYNMAEEPVIECLRKNTHFRGDDTLRFNYTVEIIGNDVIQILNRFRRTKNATP